MNRPKNIEIKVSFYKSSGKWYSSGEAVVNHYLFEDGFLQDIVNTQNCLRDGWQEHENFTIVTSYDGEENYFFEALIRPEIFKGLIKEEK
ncbi:hypothetical protein LIS82_08705 [Cytobacillus solani]|uniref:hypothetical protein n=1 Tax=Cytobacillus solani TaxID=1637975 RepID=UPI00207ABFD7|nr:hypothetical protein [Cytobacillus solani]USK56531.1 hypothetical protein LIS82_08705 [Cytobacillus solani]